VYPSEYGLGSATLLPMLSVSLDFESFRTVESNLYNKTSELQEEICLKKLDLRVAQLHLAAVKAQV